METQSLGVLSEIKPTIVLSFKVCEISVLTHLQILPLALLKIFGSLHLRLFIGELHTHRCERTRTCVCLETSASLLAASEWRS